MKREEKDEQFAAHLPSVLQYHQTMLADGMRNELLYQALKDNITENTSFMDVGAGTGVWAIVAAKLGAKRVVAIEIEECLIPIIHKHAEENGVAGKIEIIHGNSDDVRIRGKFDLIVSELFGGDALGVDLINSFVHLRQRFLAPGGLLIPQKLAMLVAPVRFENSIHDLPAGLPVKTGFLRSLKLNYAHNVPLAERDGIEFLAEPATLVEIDFRTVTTPPPLTNLTAAWKMEDLNLVNAIATFNHLTITDEIEMDGFKSLCWGAGINEFTPFGQSSGELQFTVTLDGQKGNWSVGLPSNPEIAVQSYSPVFAFARLRMAQQLTPHRKIASPKSKKEKVDKKR
jgi:SAM-dependent methyltransferase